MANWLRLILSVFALAGVLAAGTGGAWAAKAHHHCPHMTSAPMAMVDHHGGNAGDHRGAMPDCCVFGACAMTPVPGPSRAEVPFPVEFTQVFAPRLDDAGVPSLAVSPDLRPPIA